MHSFKSLYLDMHFTWLFWLILDSGFLWSFWKYVVCFFRHTQQNVLGVTNTLIAAYIALCFNLLAFLDGFNTDSLNAVDDYGSKFKTQ
jgi:hypothetical protein